MPLGNTQASGDIGGYKTGIVARLEQCGDKADFLGDGAACEFLAPQVVTEVCNVDTL